ncbi:hypothetical protein CJ030_MR8G027417 [Morella rubra]|uniref:Uncharacterized protein n=1 Tax=Morella rubra TaxID=262757 RepID=A0A6A1UXA6_9ROSI|nr:hypothetical protein CJ030_MR8G027417 [Morella rubra]
MDGKGPDCHQNPRCKTIAISISSILICIFQPPRASRKFWSKMVQKYMGEYAVGQRRSASKSTEWRGIVFMAYVIGFDLFGASAREGIKLLKLLLPFSPTKFLFIYFI